jgi:large repetitive protein
MPSAGCVGGIQRIFTATDGCGNTATASMNIIIVDNEGPVFSGDFADLTLACGEEAPLPEYEVSDNCTGVSGVEFSETEQPLSCGYQIVRTWTAADLCGNTTTAQQVITYEDNAAPAFLTFPEDVTVACGEIPEVTGGLVTYSDDCSEITADFQEYTFDGDCPVDYTIERVWTITDGCGNSDQRTWIITVVDTEGPQLFGVPADQTLTCGEEVADAIVAAVDACDSAPVVGLSAQTVQLDCGYQFIRTWIGLDACGNTTTASQIVTFTDDQAPEFLFVPEDVTVTCGEDFPAPDAIADDACSEVTVTYEDIPQQDCIGGIIRVFTATDGCGNTATASQTIAYSDTEAPVWTFVPESVVTDCNGAPDPETLSATAQDNCSDVTVTRIETLTPGACDGDYTLEITWIAQDACGNESVASTTIQVTDNQGPQIIGEITDLFLSCGEEAPMPEFDAVDACSGVAEINFEEVSGEEGCGLQIIRTWTVLDYCGNATTAQQVITYEDSAAPAFLTFPEDVTVACGEIPEITEGLVTYSDDCSEITADFQEYTFDGDCPVDYTIERVWTITDGCGNSDQRTWIITVVDTEGPQLFGVPADQTLTCGEEVADAIVAAVDACDSAPVVGLSAQTVQLDCGYQFIRTWIGLDACGNTTTASQIVTYTDDQAPEFLFVPEDVTVTCGEDFPAPDAIADDACSEVTVTYEDIPQQDCIGGIIRVFTATDGCGNTATASQTIAYSDTEAPVWTFVPESVVTDCNGAPDPETLSATAQDNCSDVTVTRIETLTPGACDGDYTLEITWIAQDACGNESVASTTIQVTDNQGPQIIGEITDLFLSCGEEAPMPEFDAVDACSGVAEINFEEVSGEEGCGLQIIRTWTVLDYCGNATTAQQVITYEDSAAPAFLTFPEDVTVACGEIPEITEGLVTYSDDCSEITADFQEYTFDGDCPVDYTIERVWTITDGCGNSDQRTWIITVVDTEGPQLFGVPADQTLTCGEEVADAIVAAVDACDSAPVVGLSAQTVQLDCGYQFIRTWIGLDACGNTTTASQIVTFTDDQAPEFLFVPEDVTVTCGEDFPAPDAIADDACSEVTVTYEDIPQQDCIGGIIRVFTATDGCGNTATASQTIAYSDTEAPVWTFVPESVVTDCNGAPDPETLSATAQDNCSDVTVTRIETLTPGACDGDYTLEITWIAQDACGNESVASTTIQVTDNQGPEFEGTFEDLTLECGEEAPLPEFSTSDACSGVAEVNFEEQSTEVDCGYVLTRTWTAIDNCGNANTVQQTITFEDNTDPYFLSFPESVTISCSDPVPPVEIPEAFDACEGPVETYFTEEQFPSSCGGSDIFRIFRAFDSCGNQAIFYQLITVVDNEAPVISGSDLVERPCDDADGVYVLASDACGGSVEIVYEDEESEETTGCAGTITRTYHATDVCGNVGTFVQVIALTDDTTPVFDSFPSDGVFSCSEIPSADTPVVQYSDNCGTPELTVEETLIPGDCANSYVLEREYTLTDACGNAEVRLWTLTVTDETGPELFGVPADMTIACGDDIEEALVFAFDDCSGIAPVGLSASTQETECGYIFTRTWFSMDECGNYTEAVQVITAESTGGPELSEYPADIILSCGDPLPEAPAVTAEDSCTGELPVNYTETVTGSTECGDTVERTWCASGCGGETCWTQTITYSENPGIVLYPVSHTGDQIIMNVRTSRNGRSSLRVYNSAGQVMDLPFEQDTRAGVNYHVKLDTRQWSSGIYHVILIQGDMTASYSVGVVE